MDYSSKILSFTGTAVSDIVDIMNLEKQIKDEELDLTGGIITITYDNGTEGTIELSQAQVIGYEKDIIRCFSDGQKHGASAQRYY